ncbi:NAD-dependent epimerase/dehydratase family protein [Candidatus Phycosocius spiralis]|nr:NAD-dependent epimerase/dehydratase family protein [Candidatus Phycosocius spiralis]
MPLQGRKFVIVGGAGLIGSAVARQLAEDGSADVIICDTIGPVCAEKWTCLPANLYDIWTPQDLLPHLERAWRDVGAIMLFADAGHRQGDGDALFETAYHLPRRLWDFAAAKQRPICWASTSQVYGDRQSDGRADPHVIATFKPTTPFGRAKQAFDLFAARQGYSPNAPPISTGFRLSSVYGAGEDHKGDWASLPTRALNAARNANKLGIWDLSSLSDVAGARDWVHVEDAASAIVQVTLQGHGGFFDIGSGTLYAPSQLLCSVEAMTGKPVHIDPIAPPRASQVSPLPAADLSHLEACGIKVAFCELAAGLNRQP